MTTRERLSVLVVWMIVSACATTFAESDPFADILPPERTTAQVEEFLKVSPPPFTQEDVDRWAAEVRPVVERVAGREFAQDPVVRVVTREELTKAITDQLVAHACRGIFRLTYEKEVEATIHARIAAMALAPLSFGQYVDGPDEMLIAAENFPGLLGLVGHESVPSEQVVKVVLAHELTHLLQDRVLGGLDLPHDEDEALAFRAVMEGQAIHVQAAVSEELGLGEAHVAVMTAMAPARVTDVDRATEAELRSGKRAYAIVYRGGYRFMRHIAANGGMECMWDVLESPPTTLKELRYPETYTGARVWKWPGEVVAFRAVADRLDAASWRRTDQRFSSAMLPVLFKDLPDAELKRMGTEAFVAGGLSAWQHKDGKAVVMVNAIRVREATDGPTMGRAFDEMARAKHDNMSKLVTVTPFQRDEHVIDGCAGGSRIPSQFTVSGDTMSMVITNAWRGKNFVSLTDGAVGADTLSDADVAEVIRAVFDAMDGAE